MGLKEFVSERFFGPPDEVHFYERVGGVMVEVDRQGNPIAPAQIDEKGIQVVSEDVYRAIQNQHRGTIKPVIGTRLADGSIQIEPNTKRKNVDSLRRAF